jgi:DNA replication protein DnaC
MPRSPHSRQTNPHRRNRRFGLLLDREVTFRDNRRLARRLAAAKLRQAATIENIDYRTARGLDRALFQSLTTSQWVREHNHLAIIGPTGTGKSRLACALGNKACRDGFSVLYKRASRLFADLAQTRVEGRLPRLMTTLERTNLIIIDDWGPELLAAEQRRDLLDIVDDRYDKGSLLITSQVPVAQWHDIIADPALGDAILDRIVHNAHRTQGRQPAPARQKEKGLIRCDGPRALLRLYQWA